MMLSQLIIFTTKGEILAYQKYQSAIFCASTDSFITCLRKEKDIPPTIEFNGITFHNIKRSNVYFVAVTKGNVDGPHQYFDILQRFYMLCKDFCGSVSEDSIRKNSLLILEIMMEYMEFGHVQLCSTDKLKQNIYSNPVNTEEKNLENLQIALFGGNTKTTIKIPSSAADRPVFGTGNSKQGSSSSGDIKNEIFVDVIERLSVLMDKDGQIIRSEVNGSIIMKCFLKGNSAIKIGLNKNLVVRSNEETKCFGGVEIDKCSFAENVNFEGFASDRVLQVSPQHGEHPIFNYNIQGPIAKLPFHLLYKIQESQDSKDLEIKLTLRCDLPVTLKAINLIGHLPVPKSTSSISHGLHGPKQTLELEPSKKLLWKIKSFPGCSEAVATIKLKDGNCNKGNSQIEIGPLALEFELSGFVTSGLKVRFLTLEDCNRSKNQIEESCRWVRYITVGESYLLRLH